jgi:hypothetical protein
MCANGSMASIVVSMEDEYVGAPEDDEEKHYAGA